MKASPSHPQDEVPVGAVIDYLERRRKDVDSIRAALDGRDGAALRHIAHRIKGNAALYGLADIGLMAGDVVEGLDRGDWDGVRRVATEMSRRIDAERRRLGPRQ